MAVTNSIDPYSRGCRVGRERSRVVSVIIQANSQIQNAPLSFAETSYLRVAAGEHALEAPGVHSPRGAIRGLRCDSVVKIMEKAPRLSGDLV